MEGDDVELWLRMELPRWANIHQCDTWDLAQGYCAESPTHYLDGITVWALTPQELVERCRALERAFALLAGKGGHLPVGQVLLGEDLLETNGTPDLRYYVGVDFAAVPSQGQNVAQLVKIENGQITQVVKAVNLAQAPTVTVPGTNRTADAIDQAKQQGYTGNTCTTCGSLQMVRNGTCEKCLNCGSTSGCS